MKIGGQLFLYDPKALVSRIGDNLWSVEFIGNPQTVLVESQHGKGFVPTRGPYDPMTRFVACQSVAEVERTTRTPDKTTK